jgi:hypothetical protein
VIVISILQYLLAATFAVIPVIAYRYGKQSQSAAEADVTKQGFPVSVLAQHGVKIEERAVDTLFPFAIALVLAALASLNLARLNIGHTMSWILQPIVLIGGGLVTATQVFVTQYVESVFRKSSDPVARAVDVKAFMTAATTVFPAGFRALVITRFVLTTLGSAAVLVLLATLQH